VPIPSPWRLENAILVDKDASGHDLYEGHGAPEPSPNVVAPGTKELLLRGMIRVYNWYANRAVWLTERADAGNIDAQEELRMKFSRAVKRAGTWWIAERDDRRNEAGRKQYYELRPLTGPEDPELVGLRDPGNPKQMGLVRRPIESAKGRPPGR
jgi:hypothetical protein